MPLYLQNGTLLQKSGALGTSVGCCCGGGLGSCNCGSPAVTRTFPNSVTVTLTLGDLAIPAAFLNSIYQAGGCCESTTAMEDAINGTYVLEPDGNGIGSNCITYILPGYFDLAWCCNSGTVSLSGQRCLMFYGEATAPVSCFGVDHTCLGKWELATAVLTGTCSQTSYTLTDFDRIVQYAYAATGSTCPGSGEIRRPFLVDITVTGNF